jgi:hypothetical protein
VRNLVYFLFFAALLAAPKTGAAQTTSDGTPLQFCGTKGYSPWLNWYQDHKDELAIDRDIDTNWLYVPVTIHLVGNNQGGGYHPIDQAIRALCEMNKQYEPAHIQHYLFPGEPFVYHNNDSWYIHDWQGGSEMINSTLLPDRLNLYIVNDPAGNCGYSWQDAIVMARSCSGAGNSTWAHEGGHHYSLPHPFYGWEGKDWDFTQPAPLDWDGYQVEKMDGSNCYTSGDRFCDTRPDYLNYRWQCDTSIQSYVVQLDPNGTPFRSDASLIMGYSYDICSNRFTTEQIAAMRDNLNTEHIGYLQTTTPGALIPDTPVNLVAPIDSAEVQYNNFTMQWDPIPNATFYNVQMSLLPNFAMSLFNGTVYDATSINIIKSIPNNRLIYWRVRAYSEWDLCHANPAATLQTGVFKTRNLSATSELERVAEISLNPNPVMGGQPAVLNVNSNETLDVLFTINDAAGRLCSSQKMRMYAGDNQYDISTMNLNPGLYYVIIQTNRGTMVKRLAVAE